MKIIEQSIPHRLARMGGWTDRVYDRKEDRYVDNTNSCQFIRNVLYGIGLSIFGLTVVGVLVGGIIMAAIQHPGQFFSAIGICAGIIVGFILFLVVWVKGKEYAQKRRDKRDADVEAGAEPTFAESAYKAWKDKFCPKLEIVDRDA